ncbi:MAG: tripartite tricarboxylate transporter substrate binding protein [Betaproteobacteria bacterium]|nr:tripartite tricarboxylate transporter substrate binding protein [Betaproteobacteria bacterium]
METNRTISSHRVTGPCATLCGWLAVAIVGCALLVAGSQHAVAASTGSGQSYPIKPIRFVVPYPPGGGADTLARAVGQKLSENLGQQVVIDNRGGAGGIIGMETAARAQPDGYTLLLGVAAYLTVNPSLYRKLPYDPVRDYSPITLMGSSSYILVVHPSVRATTTVELIALARSRPGKMNYGSSANASGNHLAGELFKTMTGTDIVHVPYKGAAAALTALLSGEVQVMFGSMLSTLPHVKSGRLRALAVTAGRSPAAPELPTIAESGVPGYYVDVWMAALAPAGTPRTIIRRLNSEFARALAFPAVRERLLVEGFEVKPGSPEELAALIKSETAKWEKVVRAANIRVE